MANARGVMEISVVVPTFNRRHIVTRTLQTLAAQCFPAAKYEIIVVVDGSIDGTADALRRVDLACRFRVIEQENRGLAGARNTGFRAAEADLILFLDDDMLCDPGLVAAHVAAHNGAGSIIGFGAIFLSPDSPHTLAAECFNREIGAYHLKHKRTPGSPWQESDCVFSNSSLPRRVLFRTGGFDESFRMREDAELGARLFASGVRPRYVPEAVAYQFYAKSSADLIRDAERFAVADLMLLEIHPEALSHGAFGRIAYEPRWKRLARQIAALSPAMVDIFLTPLCGLGQAFFGFQPIRNIGVRALQLRRSIHWYRKVLDLGGPPYSSVRD
jgi:GT2 family glycosyltransferase